jgi:two-component system OmpR family response regulator
MQQRILVVDDEEMSHRLISGVVRVLGDIVVDCALDGAEALAMAEATPPDLIISDVSMPDMDGLMLCTRLRESTTLSHIPVLLLTARGEPEDKYEGFMQGADDYMVKPFDVRELQLRVKALLRRKARPAEPVATSRFTLDEARFQAQACGKQIRLTASEQAILKYMLAVPGKVFKAELLLHEALGYVEGTGSPQVVHNHMRNIRTKLRAAGVDQELLVSSWQGYALEG